MAICCDGTVLRHQEGEEEKVKVLNPPKYKRIAVQNFFSGFINKVNTEQCPLQMML